jgi:hypothetical protein
MNPWLLLVLYALTVHRVSRLLVADSLPVIARPRDAIQRYFGEYDRQGNLIGGRQLGVVGWSIAYLLGCPWCMSVYVGTGLIFGPLGDVSIPLPWLWVAASSTVAGLLGGIVESEHELRYERMQAEIDNLRSRR